MTPGSQPRNAVDGVLLLDKPRGLSSQQAVARVKRLYSARKAGHTGTLDPMADGLLPIGLGEATKFTQYVLDADKRYLATLRLGVTTSSGDAEGEILRQRPVAVLEAEVGAVLHRFTGTQLQTPPMHSAIKIDGKPLYTYARKGIEVERKPRPVRIDDIQLVDFIDNNLKIRVTCSKGTYIRVLAEDIGAALGCGAHLTALTREAAGPFLLEATVTLDALEKLDLSGRLQRLRPADTFAGGLPRLELDDQARSRIVLGQGVGMPDLTPGLRRLYGGEGFIGVGEVVDGVLLARRLLIQNPGMAAEQPGLSNPPVTG